MLSRLTQRSNCFPSQFACLLPSFLGRLQRCGNGLLTGQNVRLSQPALAVDDGQCCLPFGFPVWVRLTPKLLSLSLLLGRNAGPDGSTGIQGSTGEASLAWLGWLCFGTNASSAPGSNAVECTRDAQSRPTPALLAPYVQHREKRDKKTKTTRTTRTTRTRQGGVRSLIVTNKNRQRH